MRLRWIWLEGLRLRLGASLGSGLRLSRLGLERLSFERLSETIGLLTNCVDGEILIIGKILQSLINFRSRSLIDEAINVLRRI